MSGSSNFQKTAFWSVSNKCMNEGKSVKFEEESISKENKLKSCKWVHLQLLQNNICLEIDWSLLQQLVYI